MTGLPCAFPLSRPPLSMRSKKDGAPRELAERRDWADLDSPGGRVSQKTARGPVTASSPPASSAGRGPVTAFPPICRPPARERSAAPGCCLALGLPEPGGVSEVAPLQHPASAPHTDAGPDRRVRARGPASFRCAPGFPGCGEHVSPNVGVTPRNLRICDEKFHKMGGVLSLLEYVKHWW